MSLWGRGATVDALRDHFNQWVATALEEEQGVASNDCRQSRYNGQSGRYRIFAMVDQEGLKSVLGAPEDDEKVGSVCIVNGEWEPKGSVRTRQRRSMDVRGSKSHWRAVGNMMQVG